MEDELLKICFYTTDRNIRDFLVSQGDTYVASIFHFETESWYVVQAGLPTPDPGV